MSSFWLEVLSNVLFDSFFITHKDRKSIENLKNRESETASLEGNSRKKRELEKTASLEPRVCEGLVYSGAKNKSDKPHFM